jgi:uncharacterized protein involved in exopolysaccharide biosynthesis/Mrp family chromosome partitioning ATPase
MQKSPPKSPERSIGVQDILFILCKHKWMILILALLGLGAAAAVYKTQKPLYQSEAKLLVRYVMETGSVDTFNRIKSPGGGGRGGDPVLITEMEILSSADLATEVVSAIGIEKLLPEVQGLVNPTDAARVISSNLLVEPVKGGSVLRVNFKNGNPELCKQVLREVVERYFNKHLEIHRSAAAFDMVSKQAEEVRGRLERTEKELNRLRTESGIVSLEDAMNALSSQRNRVREELMQARAALAEQQANVQALGKNTGLVTESGDAGSADTGEVDASAVALAEDVTTNDPPPNIVREYRALLDLLTYLQKRDLDLRVKFKPGNRLQIQNQEQMDSSDARRQELLDQYPGLASQAAVSSSDPNDPARSLDMAQTRLAAIAARVKVLEENLREIAEQFSQQMAAGTVIDSLERQRQMEATEYSNLELNLKNARIDQTLDPSRMPNITMVQQPTEPVKVLDEFAKKLVLGLAAGGLALGLGIAFLLEMVFNRKIERPAEIQARLQLPLMLTIPYIRKNARGGKLLGAGPDIARIGGGSDDWKSVDEENALAISSPRSKPAHFILPFSETIRDRIIFNFQINNIIHKPKLIAVTGMSEGAGASTVAAGLAKSFSEIKDSKVLLVDLSSYHPDQNPMVGEVPRHSLPNALRIAQDSDFRENPQSLYYANASARREEGGVTQFTPLHLHQMMPMLHASEYDYIIFDMPALAQTSPTITMAGLMDKVLLVLDAENTSREGLKWGYSELTRGRADVSCIFNKSRSHGPEWLLGAH